MSKRILILGCGYVGRALALDALGCGIQVVGITRNAESVAQLKDEGVEAYACRVDSDDWHDLVGTDFDYAINCVSSAGNGITGYRESYLDGNRSFLRWMTSSRFSGRAIYTSSVSVYPDRQGEWVAEVDAKPSSERGEIMRQSELIFLGGSLPNESRTVLRLGGIYGPYRHMLLNRVRSLDTVFPGSGDYFLNLIRLEDIVSAIWAVFHGERDSLSPIYNVVDDQPVEKATLVAWLASQLGLPQPKFDPKTTASNSSRRFSNETQAPSNRRISNRLLHDHCSWQPRFPTYREGFADLLMQEQ